MIPNCTKLIRNRVYPAIWHTCVTNYYGKIVQTGVLLTVNLVYILSQTIPTTRQRIDYLKTLELPKDDLDELIGWINYYTH